MQNAGVSFIEGEGKKHEKAPTELAEEERVITTKQAMLDNCINYKKYHEGFIIKARISTAFFMRREPFLLPEEAVTSAEKRIS